ncbi:MAG TPA: glycerol-3-phosphate 1-O-acyltransferase PlsY [Treponemataceae bacterium]|nr:glycerol-3-phosphate 1-O-acyltransferase PlsY [Treponemataceae bacterium]
MFLFVLALLLSALAGSIPSAYIAGKVVLKEDIRTLGSGNAGATNVLRVMGLKAALPVFFVDFCKGFIPVLCIVFFGSNGWPLSPLHTALIAGVLSFLGHVYSPFIGFRGGKGMATGAGVFSALVPFSSLVCLFFFCLVFFISHKASLASLAASVTLPFAYIGIVIIRGNVLDPFLLTASIIVPCVVIIRHRKNIINLLKGEERPLF